MDDPLALKPPSREVGELTESLLDCGGVLSQIISHMVAFTEAGHAAPDAAPIPEIAFSLLGSTIQELRKTYSRRDVLTAARIVEDATGLIAHNIYAVNPDTLELDLPELD